MAAASGNGQARPAGFPLALVLAGLLAGLAGGYAGAVRLAWDLDTERLGTYAQVLEDRMARVVEESFRVFDVVHRANLDFCGNDEIALLRSQNYRTRYIKDVGRLRDGFLVCTAATGRLMRAYDARDDSMLMTPEGVAVAPSAPLVTAPGNRAIVAQYGDINVVVDSELFDDLVRPPLIGAYAIVDANDGVHGPGQYIATFTGADYRAGRSVYHADRFMAAGCAPRASLCYVASLDRLPAWRSYPMLTAALLLGGAGLGVSTAMMGREVLRRRLALHRRLRRALHGSRLDVVYQPVVRLSDRRIVAAEALVRWSPGGTPIPPDIFVAEAEANGLIGELTRYVLARAVADLGPRLRDRGFRVTVNIAASDLGDERFYQALDRHIGAAALAPGAIGIELTERSTADRALILAGLDRLHNAGLRVYLDDFGTGYSALSYLTQLPIDVIKVDKSFTDTIGSGSARASLVPQIIDMARHLGAEIVVEGIETEEQAAYLAAYGAQYGQGWLFARPMRADALLSLLEADTRAGSG